jgi:hypothetical protein
VVLVLDFASGDEDKRGMLNFIAPEMIVNAAKLVTRGKVYALGEEMHNDVPRLITPVRFGPQILQERDGYDRITKAGEFDPKQRQGAASYTIMHNHTGSHLDTLATSTGRTSSTTTSPHHARMAPFTVTRPA